MTQQSFLSEILARIAVAGLRWTQTVGDTSASLISLCHSLVRDVSEAEGLNISRQVLDIYTAAGAAEKAAFFSAVRREFGPNDTALSERGKNDLPQDDFATKLAARFLTEAQKSSGSAADPLAHFHLGKRGHFVARSCMRRSKPAYKANRTLKREIGNCYDTA